MKKIMMERNMGKVERREKYINYLDTHFQTVARVECSVAKKKMCKVMSWNYYHRNIDGRRKKDEQV
jgi:hypothetical protein